MPPMLTPPKVLPMPASDAAVDPVLTAPAPSRAASDAAVQPSQLGSYKPYSPASPRGPAAGSSDHPDGQVSGPSPSGRTDPAPKTSAAPASSTVVALLVPPRIPRSVGIATNTSSSPTAHEGKVPAVQFSASPSEHAANAFWQSLVHKYPDTLGQREASVSRVQRGGTVFWRLRTEGFDSVSQAQSLCSRMRAFGQNCFVPRS
jgi:hypothetical protein